MVNSASATPDLEKQSHTIEHIPFVEICLRLHLHTILNSFDWPLSKTGC